MRKLLSGVLVSAALFAPSVALADPPNKCPVFADPDITTPGDVNKLIKDIAGTPGQNTLDPPLPANEFAQIKNDARKEVCPPPGKS